MTEYPISENSFIIGLNNIDSSKLSPLIRLRYLVVLNTLKEKSSREVARIFEIGKDQVIYWKNRFLEEGLEGLKDKKRPGRPSKINMEELDNALKNNPQEYGFEENEWNKQIIIAYLREYQGVRTHENYIYQVLKKINFKIKKTSKNTRRIHSHPFDYPRTMKGQRITERHLEMMTNVAKILDAPIHKILEKGIAPVLKIVYSDKNTAILEGKSENGVLTIKYEEYVKN